MNVSKDKKSLNIELNTDFNLYAVRKIEGLLDERTELRIDLAQSRFVNSKAVLYLNKLIQANIKVRLKNPPKILFETLHLLGLHEKWDLKSIVEP
jgi:hypothetical protein